MFMAVIGLVLHVPHYLIASPPFHRYKTQGAKRLVTFYLQGESQGNPRGG